MRKPCLKPLIYGLPLTGLMFQLCPAYAGGALPTSGHFVAGQGTITTAPGSVTVNQSSTYGIIDWQSFSIGTGNKVAFQNGSGATLDRVTGGDLSQILGSLTATGSIYLINPQGIVIGPSGKVATGGSFIASTRDVDNAAFMAGGALDFIGSSTGDVVNQGAITSTGGDVVLIGRGVTNGGSISAANGTAGLAAGDEVLLQPAGVGQRIFVKSGSGDVTNTGAIAAAQAELRAAGGNVYALAGNNGGIIRATGTANRDGHVWLSAGGNVTASGGVTAANADGSGGTVEITAGKTLALSGQIDASAQGSTGAGGQVVVKSAGSTEFTGSIAARGGAQGGNGGSAEVSGEYLDFKGAIDLTAAHGTTGTLLLDPQNLTIQTAGPSTTTKTGGTFTGNVANSVLKVSDLRAALAGSNVVVMTGTGGTQSGDITVAASVTWSSNTTLTLAAYRTINISKGVTISNTAGGSLVLAADTGAKDSGTVLFATGAAVDFSKSKGNVQIFYHPSTYPNATNFSALVTKGAGGFSAYMTVDNPGDLQAINKNLTGSYALNANLDMGNVKNFVPLGTQSTPFTGALIGQGYVIDNLTISSTNPFLGLFGMIGTGGRVSNIALTDESITSLGFNTYAAVGGLAGENDGKVSSSYVTGTVTDKSAPGDVGGLIGANIGTVQQSYASDAVTALQFTTLGGLVGNNSGTISQSYATGAVNGAPSSGLSGGLVGGLVGSNNGTISISYATGKVSGPDFGFVGGLVGQNNSDPVLATITSSYASGVVSGGQYAYVGGLVGDNNGVIAKSFAKGSALVGDQGAGGGLVGLNAGIINQSYATSKTTGTDYTQLGGLAGYNLGSISQSYATGAVAGGVGTEAGGLVGINYGSIDQTYSIGKVTGGSGSVLGGLLAEEFNSTSNSYWNTQTSGQATSANGTGQTTKQLKASLPAGFSTNAWGFEKGNYPFLKWQGGP